MKKIELNADLGEGCAGDAQILPFIDAANIACGGHSGDRQSMQQTLLLARRHGVSAGAHPSYPDRQHFGRRALKMDESELQHSLRQQLQQLGEIATAIDYPLRHIKPHGALYNQCAVDSALADRVVECFARFDDRLIIVGLAGGELTRIAGTRGLKTQQEGFVDRRYRDDGSLQPRSDTDAVIGDIDAAFRQAQQIVATGQVTSINQRAVPLAIDTLCLHGDGKHAVALAQRLSALLRSSRDKP